MTNEELQAHLAAINAAHKAGEIQFSASETLGAWTDSRRRSLLLLDPLMWRIKPIPREVWIARVKLDAAGDKCLASSTCRTYTMHTDPDTTIDLVKFREVIE